MKISNDNKTNVSIKKDVPLPLYRHLPLHRDNKGNLQVLFWVHPFLVGTIEARFDQPDYKICLQLQQVLIKSSKGCSCKEKVKELGYK